MEPDVTDAPDRLAGRRKICILSGGTSALDIPRSEKDPTHKMPRCPGILSCQGCALTSILCHPPANSAAAMQLPIVPFSFPPPLLFLPVFPFFIPLISLSVIVILSRLFIFDARCCLPAAPPLRFPPSSKLSLPRPQHVAQRVRTRGRRCFTVLRRYGSLMSY